MVRSISADIRSLASLFAPFHLNMFRSPFHDGSVAKLLLELVDSRSIVLLVVDEAHKAQGNYAYVQVVKKMAARSRYFRVLAMTATPGSDVNAIQQVPRLICSSRPPYSLLSAL